MATTHIQDALREQFKQYGLPKAIRVDNGGPWGKYQNTPSWLALWLVGLGVQVIWNRPRTPKDNPQIERGNRLIDDWSEPQHCETLAVWQDRLDEMITLQRDQYLGPDGLSRTQRHPEFYAQPRPYRRQDEAALWDLMRVKRLLAEFEWQRRVSRQGQITVMNQRFSVGRAHSHTQVTVRFDPADTTYLVKTLQGHLIIRQPASDITTETILSLASSARQRKRSAKPL